MRAACLCLLIVPVPAAAESVEPAGPPFVIHSPYSSHPAGGEVLAADASGRFVAMWSSPRGIHARRFDASGSPLGGAFRVDEPWPGDRLGAAVAMDALGNFVVHWENREPTGLYRVYARRFDASGNAIGPSVRVNTTPHGFSPAVAMARSGEFVTAWTGGAAPGMPPFQVHIRRYDASGLPLGDAFRAGTTTNQEFYPAVGMDARGNFVVSWLGGPGAGGITDVYARRFDATGRALGGEFRVNLNPANGFESCFYASVSVSPLGAFVVAWSGLDPVLLHWVNGYASSFDREGARQLDLITASPFAGARTSGASASLDGRGNFVIEWAAWDSSSGDAAILAQLFSAIGVPQTGPLIVASGSALPGLPPLASGGVQMTGETSFVVEWGASDVLYGRSYVVRPESGPPAALHTVAPCRAVDTRDPPGPLAGPSLAAGRDRLLSLAGSCDIPSTAKAVVLNVAVTAATDPGHLKLYPADSLAPASSAINYGAGQTRSSHATVALAPGAQLGVRCEQQVGTVDLILDVNGYFE
jgi:hypothetical protein